MNKLAAYLDAHGVSNKAFAERVGCSRVMVSLMRAGTTPPGLRLAAKIERETDGAVPATSWVEAAE